MSTTSKSDQPVRRITVPQIAGRKGGEPVVCLTAYTTPFAQLLDDHCDLLLIGDSMGMVIYGWDSTLPVTLHMVIQHGKAVMNGAKRACVIVDMPFGTYEESPEVAFRNCAQVMKETGVQGVKLEGGTEMAPTIRYLIERGIPVMAHIGLKPQSVNTLGGFKAQGRGRDEWKPILADAKAVQEAGAFSVVLEGVAEPLAREITEMLDIVTIGIGASVRCDGQILVTEDLLGLFPWNPKFVKRYAELGAFVTDAVERYADDVRNRRFPEDEQTYTLKKDD